jgi:hypothetical protein
MIVVNPDQDIEMVWKFPVRGLISIANPKPLLFSCRESTNWHLLPDEQR